MHTHTHIHTHTLILSLTFPHYNYIVLKIDTDFFPRETLSKLATKRWQCFHKNRYKLARKYKYDNGGNSLKFLSHNFRLFWQPHHTSLCINFSLCYLKSAKQNKTKKEKTHTHSTTETKQKPQNDKSKF